MKYKIIKSDILLKGKLIPENSEVNLSQEDIKGIEEFLLPLDVKEPKEETKIKKGNK